MPTTDLARRNSGAPAAPSATLAIRSGQSMWDDKQRAALVAMGVSSKATMAELAVFFHQCQKLRLDPFTKQIYLIHRRAKEGDKWVDKPTTQIGIDGFRVTRDRIAAERGVSVEYEETIWYDAQGQDYEVWLWDEPPTACKFVVRVDGRRFPSVLRFNEYCQRDREGNRTGKWRDAHAHQIEKCAEADSLRRAFPNDLSGVILEDAAPLDDPDAQPERQRVTAKTIAARRNAVPSNVVDPDPSPAYRQQTPRADATAAVPTAESAGEAPADRPPAGIASGQRSQIEKEFKRLGIDHETGDGYADMLTACARINGIAAIAGLIELTQDEAAKVIALVKPMKNAQELTALLQDGVAPDA